MERYQLPADIGRELDERAGANSTDILDKGERIPLKRVEHELLTRGARRIPPKPRQDRKEYRF